MKARNLLKLENFYSPGMPNGELCIFSLDKPETNMETEKKIGAHLQNHPV